MKKIIKNQEGIFIDWDNENIFDSGCEPIEIERQKKMTAVLKL